MGQTASALYGHSKRLLNRYNAEYRAHKFLEAENLPKAPRHPTLQRVIEKQQVSPEKKRELAEIHEKNEQLDKYLNKVYLTSTPKKGGELVVSKRPLPVKRVVDLPQMFYEPEQVSAGHLTLTSIIEIMIQYSEDPKQWTPDALADHYNVDKEIVVKLLTHYSLFKVEKLEFMKLEKEEEKEPEKIEFEVYSRLEKKPLKKIQGKS